MVKIIGLTEEEVALKEKKNDLEQIAKKFLNSNGINRVTVNHNGSILIKYKEMKEGYPIYVIPEEDIIYVELEAYLKEAISLGELYEKNSPNEEWTVKKTYER